MDFFSPLMGGALIGLAAGALFWAHGRIMGVSGILSGLLPPALPDSGWRKRFLLGVFLGGLSLLWMGVPLLELEFSRSDWAGTVGGLLVGVGTTLGSGCTSGHGVCGMSRLSSRSLVATVVFMASGILTVAVIGLLGGQI